MSVKVPPFLRRLYAASRAPVAVISSTGFHVSTGSEGVVVAPYVKYGRGYESFVLLLSRSDLQPLRPVERLHLLSLGDYEVGVDVYRSPDVPDDAIAVNLRISSRSDEEAYVYVEAAYTDHLLLQESEREQLKELVRQFVRNYCAMEPTNISFIPFLEKAIGREGTCVALRLPPNSEYLLLPRVDREFSVDLYTGGRTRWTRVSRRGEACIGAVPYAACIRLYELPRPSESYAIVLVAIEPVTAPTDAGGRKQRRVHVLEYRLTPDWRDIKKAAMKLADILFHTHKSWIREDFDAPEVEEALLEALEQEIGE